MTSPKLIYGDEVAAILTQALTTDLIQDVARRNKFLEQAGLLLTNFFGGDLAGIGHAECFRNQRQCISTALKTASAIPFISRSISLWRSTAAFISTSIPT